MSDKTRASSLDTEHPAKWSLVHQIGEQKAEILRLRAELLDANEALTVAYLHGYSKASEQASAENAKLRAALKPFADEAERHNRLCLGSDIDHWSIDVSRLTLGDLRAAAAALKEAGDDT